MNGWIWLAVGLVLAAVLVWAVLRFTLAGGVHKHRRQLAHLASRAGWRYYAGAHAALAFLHGEPFERGNARFANHLMIGEDRGRTVAILELAWRYSVTKRAGAGFDGNAAAVLIELPSPQPELRVRWETAASDLLDHLGVHDLQLESVQFNQTFNIRTRVERFAYDVLHPRMMEWLLANMPRDLSFRIDGPMLVVWRDGGMHGNEDAERLLAFAHGLRDRIPDFVWGNEWVPELGHTDTPLSAIPGWAFGKVPTDIPLNVRQFQHQGFTVEVFEQYTTTLTATQPHWTVSAQVFVPAYWPTSVVRSRMHGGVSPDKRHLDFSDRVQLGDQHFESMFAIGSPNPAFVHDLLHPEFRRWLATDPRVSGVQLTTITGYVERDRDNDQPHYRGMLIMSKTGRMSDPGLVHELLETACEAARRVPRAAYQHRAPLESLSGE